MSHESQFSSLSDAQAVRLAPPLERFDAAWRQAQPLGFVELLFVELLNECPTADRPPLLRELLRIERQHRHRKGESPQLQEYIARLANCGPLSPADESLLRALFQEPLDAPAAKLDTDLQSADSSVAPGKQRSSSQVDEGFQNSSTLNPPNSPAPAGTPSAARLPESIGRYRIDCELGRGGFGVVYKALDSELERAVAIKVPSQKRIAQAGGAELFRREARKVAKLDHPNIVRVYDVGSSDDLPCFIVYEFIDGSDLSKSIRHQRPSFIESARIVKQVAEALHEAHKNDIVHRDVKPANILLRPNGKAYLTDFGLARTEDQPLDWLAGAGTPAYMSPEQVRGSAGCRSDVFSLGVVLFELLAGRRPYQDAGDELIRRMTSDEEIDSPRRYDELIPRSLEEICLKALAKRPADRYRTAYDMAQALRQFLDTPVSTAASHSPAEPAASAAPTATPTSDTDTTSIRSGSEPVEITFKGLRSFESADHRAFLQLLPDYRPGGGLPERFVFGSGVSKKQTPNTRLRSACWWE
jgi:serine/threonine protein kinase